MKKNLNTILLLTKEKKFLEAKDCCLNILKSNKEDEEIYNIYAIILFQLKEFDQAIVNWKKSIKVNPNFTHAHNNLGKVLLKQRKFNEAILSFNIVTEIDPKYFEAHYHKALAFSATRMYAKAIASWDCVINLKPDFIEGRVKRGDIFFDLRKSVNLSLPFFLIKSSGSSPFGIMEK